MKDSYDTATVVAVTPTDNSSQRAHYFDNDPAVSSTPRRVHIGLPDMDLELGSDAGVFSADRLDSGTKLLLLEAPPLTDTDRTVLDIGCGWGAIACVVAARKPLVDVWAIDVNERARHLTAANAESLGFGDRVHVCKPEMVPSDIRFDRILSNPPIRIGKTPLHNLLTSWLDRLTPSGVAHFVVQKHLGSDSLTRWLQQRGHPVERVTSRAGYRLLEVGPR